jgi:restriction system protein
MTIEPHWFYYKAVLEILNGSGPIHYSSLRDLVADRYQLPNSERSKKNQRGTNIFGSRVHWAHVDLVGIGALTRPGKGLIQISDFGKNLMFVPQDQLNRKYLMSLPEWELWKVKIESKKESKSEVSEEFTNSLSTPDEILDATLDELNDSLASSLISKIQSLPPSALEKLVLSLLFAMDYGATEDSLQHLGGPGDEGVDGVINLDTLGLQKLYVQAKRYKDGSKITPDTIQSFIGALVSKRAVGGVFITTSDFTQAAREAAAKSTLNITLVNGGELGKLLIENGIGVRVRQVINRSEMDESYFEDLEA